MPAVTGAPWTPHLPAGVPFEPGDLTADGSLPRRWARQWSAEPEAPAIVVAEGLITAGELEDRTAEAALALSKMGLRPGERLLWSPTGDLGSVVACLGALRLGAVVVPVNPAYTEREIGHMVRDVRPQAAVVASHEQARWVADHSGGETAVLGPDLEPVPVAVAPPPTRTTEEPALDAAGPADPALVVYTSGTTGTPKGAVLTHGNLLAGAASLALAWRWSPDDRLVLALPLFHVHGLAAGLLGTLAAGASAVLVQPFDPSTVQEAAARHRASMFFGVPTMYRRLLESAGADWLGKLRLCVSGSAPLPAGLWREVQDRAATAVLERYGMTETLLTVSNPVDGERRPGSVGFPLPGVEARLEEDGAELWVRGPTVFAGYWERPAATAESFSDGWFRTGDLFGHDGAGYLCVRGRARDLIISGGYNVYPAEVEDVLLAHPAVAEVAVAGLPSEEWGETVVAWVVADGAVDGDEVLSFAAERLAPYKRPRVVRLVDQLPRNAMGKVQRSELR